MPMSIRLSLVTLTASVLLIGVARDAQATPGSGYCVGCHGVTANKTRSAAMDLAGFDSTMAVSNRLDGGTANPLPTYTVQPGGTAKFSFTVNDGRNNYSLALFGLDAGGVQTSASNKLSFTVASALTLRTDPDTSLPYYALSAQSWGSTSTNYDFTMTLDAATPPDVYALEVIAAGRGPGSITTPNVQWADPEAFYLNVVNAVPEPSALVALIGCGAVGLVWWSRRRRQNG